MVFSVGGKFLRQLNLFKRVIDFPLFLLRFGFRNLSMDKVSREIVEKMSTDRAGKQIVRMK